MPPLPWMQSDVVKESDDWGFASTVSSGLDSIKELGSSLMQPVAQQVASLMPQPAPAPAPADPEIPEVLPFQLPDMTSWGIDVSEPRQQPQGHDGPQGRPTIAPGGARTSVSDRRPFGHDGVNLGPEPPTPATATTGTPGAATGGFQLPGPEAWGMPAVTRAAAAVGSGVQAAGRAVQSATGTAPTDVNAYLKHAALKAGIDPSQVLAVMGKEGPTGWGSVGTFDTGTSYGPLQLHYAGGSNPKEGMGDRFTKATGIDLRKDTSVAAHQAAVDFAMGELARRGDWSEWYGAEPALGSRFTKVKRIPVQGPPTAGEPGGPPLAPGPVLGGPTSTAAPKFGTYTPENLTPNQVQEGAAQGLTAGEALAVCGPAAAVAFARANGRNPTLREAKELAQNLGLWDEGTGMHGPATQVQLLQKMGVESRLEEGTDWTKVAQEVQQGRPVIVDTPQHYFTVTGYDPQSGTFEFGQSAGVLKASKGRTRYRPDELSGLGMGAPRATIYLGGR